MICLIIHGGASVMFKNIIDFFFSPYTDNLMDFSLLELFLSVFLGFLSAMAVEALWNNRNEKELKKQLSSALLDELKQVESTLSKLKKDKVYLYPFHVPVWKGARDSGTILCLNKKKYYRELLQVYSQIEESNIIETKAFELVFSKDYKSNDHRLEVLGPILAERTELSQNLKLLFNKMKEK